MTPSRRSNREGVMAQQQGEYANKVTTTQVRKIMYQENPIMYALHWWAYQPTHLAIIQATFAALVLTFIGRTIKRAIVNAERRRLRRNRALSCIHLDTVINKCPVHNISHSLCYAKFCTSCGAVVYQKCKGY